MFLSMNSLYKEHFPSGSTTNNPKARMEKHGLKYVKWFSSSFRPVLRTAKVWQHHITSELLSLGLPDMKGQLLENFVPPPFKDSVQETHTIGIHLIISTKALIDFFNYYLIKF